MMVSAVQLTIFVSTFPQSSLSSLHATSNEELVFPLIAQRMNGSYR